MEDRGAQEPASGGVRRWTRLPDPIRLEDTITSAEASPLADEQDGAWHEVEWMLRTSGIV